MAKDLTHQKPSQIAKPPFHSAESRLFGDRLANGNEHISTDRYDAWGYGNGPKRQGEWSMDK
jgi:hypothetical protein